MEPAAKKSKKSGVIWIKMEPEEKKRRKSYITWSKDDRRVLVEKRIEMDSLFTGKITNSMQGWRDLMDVLRPILGESKSLEACKAQWKSIKKKYNSFFINSPGNEMGDDNINEDAYDWDLFDIFHKYAQNKHNYHTPLLISSEWGLKKHGSKLPTAPSSTSRTATTTIPATSKTTATTTSFSSRTKTPATTITPPNKNLTTVNNSNLSREYILEQMHETMSIEYKEMKEKLDAIIEVYAKVVKETLPQIDVTKLLK